MIHCLSSDLNDGNEKVILSIADIVVYSVLFDIFLVFAFL